MPHMLGMKLGNTTLVGIRKSWNGAVLFGHHATLLGINLGCPMSLIRHGNVLYGHHNTFLGMSLSQQGAVLYGYNGTLGPQGILQCGLHATLIEMSLCRLGDVLSTYMLE